jgi:hypothetical protein
MAEEKKDVNVFYAELEEKIKWYMSHKTKVRVASELLSKYSEEVKNDIQHNLWWPKNTTAEKYWNVIRQGLHA